MTSPVLRSPGSEVLVQPETAAPRGVAGSRSGAASGDSFGKVLGALGREIDGGERLVARAVRASHGGLGPGDLIALQAGIYRYSEAMDLTAKLVDRAASAVRTTLQGSG